MRTLLPSMDELVDTMIDGLRFYSVRHTTDKQFNPTDAVSIKHVPAPATQGDWFNSLSEPAPVAPGLTFKSLEAWKSGDTVIVRNNNGALRPCVVICEIKQPTDYDKKIAWIVGSIDIERMNEVLEWEQDTKDALVDGQRDQLRQRAIRDMFGDIKLPQLSSGK